MDKNIDIKIKVSSGQSKQTIEDVHKSLEKTGDIQKDLNKSTLETAKANETLDNSITKVTTNNNALSISLTKVNKSNKDLGITLISLADNLTTIGVKLGSLAFDNITEPIKNATNEFKNFSIALGATAVATTTTNVLIAKNLLDSFKPLNKEMANVNSILLESPQGFKKLNEKVRDLSLSMKLASETQIAKGLYDVASSGYKGSDALTIMDTSIKASKAGRAELRDSSMLIAQSLNAMGKSAGFAEHFANVFFKTVQRGVIEFPDLAKNTGRVISQFNTLGQTVETLGASISILTRKGTLPEQAFTNLNSLLLSFSAMSITAKQEASRLGIQMDANAVKTKGFATVLEEVVTAAKGTGDLEGTLFKLLGRQEALDAALKLSNAEEFKQEIKEFTNVSTAMSDALREQSKSLTDQLEQTQNGLEAIKTEAGGMIASIASGVLPIINAVIDDFNSLSESGRKTMLTFTGITLAIPAAIAAFGATTLGIGLLVAQMVLTKFILKLLIQLLSPLISLVGQLALVLKNAAVSMYTFASGTTAGSSALTTLKASLMATVSTMGAYVVILGSAAIAAGILLKLVLDLDRAQEQQRKDENRNYDVQEESIKKIAELRKKESDGIKLTAKEQREYAKALVSMGDINPILKKQALERMEIAKKLEKEQNKQEQQKKPLTDEQKENKKNLLSSLNDEQMSLSEDSRKKATYDADKWRKEELDKVASFLKLNNLTEEEAQKARLQINSIYNQKILKADKDYQDKLKSQKEKAEKELDQKAKAQSDSKEKVYLRSLSNIDNDLNNNSSNYNEGNISFKQKISIENKLLASQKSIYKELLKDNKILSETKSKYYEKESELTKKISLNNSSVRKQSLKERLEEEKNITEASIRNIEKEKEIHNTSNSKYINDLMYAYGKHKERLQNELKNTSLYSDQRKSIIEEIKTTEVNIDNLITKNKKDELNKRLQAIDEYYESIRNYSENEYKLQLDDIEDERNKLDDSYKFKKIKLDDYINQQNELLDEEKRINNERLDDFKISEAERENLIKRNKEIEREKLNNAQEIKDKIEELNKDIAKSFTDTLANALEPIAPGIGKIFDVLIEKNDVARNEIIKTASELAKMAGLKIDVFKPNSQTTQLASEGAGGGIVQGMVKDGIPKALSESSDQLKQWYKETSNSFNKLPSNFELPKTELKAIETTTTKVASNTANAKKEMKDFSLESAAAGIAIEGIAKGLNAGLEEVKKGLSGQIRTAEDLQDSNVRMAKAMPAGIGLFAEITDIPRQAQKLKEETLRQVNQMKASLSGNKLDLFGADMANIQAENTTPEIKALTGAMRFKEFSKVVLQDAINSRKFEISLIKDKKLQIEETYQIQLREINLIDDITERNLKLREADEARKASLMEFDKRSRELDIELTTDKQKNIKMWYENEVINLKESEANWEMYTKKLQLLDREKFEKSASFFLELARLSHQNQELNDDESTKSIKKAQDDLAELDKSSEDFNIKEQKRIGILKTLEESLNKIKLSYYDDIEKVMSKYYDKELKYIKENHKADYALIQDKEKKIKSNQIQIDKLQNELDKINKEFDKKLSDKNITKTASTLFSQERNSFMGKNNGLDLANLLRTPVTEFERTIAAAKEQIDIDFTNGTITADEKAEQLKKLSLEQNIFFGELSKGIVKNTKEYDKYIKLANDGFRDYKTSVKDSIEAQKQNIIETKKLTESIDDLTSKNDEMQQEINNANNNINADIDSLTSKFKTASGEWISDINLARTALQGISFDAKAAITELNKVSQAKEIATNTNVSSIKATNISAPTTSKNNGLLPGQLQGETYEQMVARFKKEDAANANASNAFNNPYSNNDKSIYQDPFSKVSDINNVNLTAWNAIKLTDELLKVANAPKLATGGITKGPSSGYPAILHDEEMVLNKRQGNNLAWLYNMAINPKLPSSNSSTQHNQIIINGSQLSEKQLTSAINNAMDKNRVKNNMSYI